MTACGWLIWRSQRLLERPRAAQAPRQMRSLWRQSGIGQSIGFGRLKHDDGETMKKSSFCGGRSGDTRASWWEQDKADLKKFVNGKSDHRYLVALHPNGPIKGDLVTSKIGHWPLPPSVEGRGGSANANTSPTSRLEQIRGILHPTVGAWIIASARIVHRSRPAWDGGFGARFPPTHRSLTCALELKARRLPVFLRRATPRGLGMLSRSNWRSTKVFQPERTRSVRYSVKRPGHFRSNVAAN